MLILIKKLKEVWSAQVTLQSVFSWISNHRSAGTSIAVHTAQNTTWYTLNTSRAVRPIFSTVKDPDFHIYMNDLAREAQKHQSTSWTCLMSTQNFELWEKIPQSNTLPLRFGLSDSEKKELLFFARAAMSEYLQTHVVPQGPTSTRYVERYGVDVALWVDGFLRGSSIHTEETFGQNFVKAACHALTDTRFKPVTHTELERATIEIVLISDLSIPLVPKRKLVEMSIESHLGHNITVNGSIRGWYLPQVFNSMRFDSFPTFIHSLTYQKAKLQKDEALKARAYIFPVFDFVEQKNGHPLTLSGPVPATTSVAPCLISDLNDIAKSSADYLACLITEEGYIPPIIFPSFPSHQHYDIVRSIFTALSLVEYGLYSNQSGFIKKAQQLVTYGQKVLDGQPLGDASVLARTYLAQYYFLIREYALSAEIADNVYIYVTKNKSHNIILISQVARLHKLLNTNRDTELTSSIVKRFFDDIQKQKEVSLAEYAELVSLTIDSDSIHRKVLSWYISQQLASGAFQNTTLGGVPYIRGTGKVLEVLATTSCQDEILLRGFLWAKRYQYTEDTLFHAPKERHPQLIGGFRHDDFNRDVWIDGVAHVLIAISRYLSKKQ